MEKFKLPMVAHVSEKGKGTTHKLHCSFTMQDHFDGVARSVMKAQAQTEFALEPGSFCIMFYPVPTLANKLVEAVLKQHLNFKMAKGGLFINTIINPCASCFGKYERITLLGVDLMVKPLAGGFKYGVVVPEWEAEFALAVNS